MLDFSTDLKQSANVEFIVSEKMTETDITNGEDDLAEALRQGAEEEKQNTSLPRIAPRLQWGQRKRSWCSRDDNHSMKPCARPDNSAFLFCKSVRVEADKSAVRASLPKDKGALKAAYDAATQKEHIHTAHGTIQARAHQGEKRETAKILKNGFPGSPAIGSKRRCPVSAPKQEPEKKGCRMPELRSVSPEACIQPNVAGEASPSKAELVWPKFVIQLSRKEKEEDFLILKGSKLPQRPKRRPKAAERLLHFCSPGSWLVDMSHSRYDVREKKCAKKKPRGLKAMGRLESGSE